MTSITGFVQETKKAFSNLALTPLEIDEQVRAIRMPGGSVTLEAFKAAKFEKIVFCTITIAESGVVESTAMAWPDDDHAFPLLWCNLTIVPEVMNVPVFDFIPMMDIIHWPEYATRYVEGISDLKVDALEALGDTVIQKAVDLPSRTVYALSPYKCIPMITEEGIAIVPRIAAQYIAAYLKLAQAAAPVIDSAERAFYLNRKKELRTLMKANDPGYPFMVDVFGPELTHQVFDAVF